MRDSISELTLDLENLIRSCSEQNKTEDFDVGSLKKQQPQLTIKIEKITFVRFTALHCCSEVSECERDSSSSKCHLVFQLGEGFGV